MNSSLGNHFSLPPLFSTLTFVHYHLFNYQIQYQSVGHSYYETLAQYLQFAETVCLSAMFAMFHSNLINTTIQKLKGDNYLPWKRQITILLKLKGLGQALHDGAPEEIDMQSILIVLEAMDDSHRLQVQSESTAKAMLDNVERQYADRSLPSKHRLLYNFLKVGKSSSETLNEHVRKLKEMRAALTDLGEEYSEDFFQVIIILSLGGAYGDILGQWEIIHPSMKSTEFLLSILKQKEEGCALAVKELKKWSELSIDEKKKLSKCKKCGIKGHWARQCTATGGDKPEPVTSASVQHSNILFNVAPTKSYLKRKWVLDSGASHHMSCIKEWFEELNKPMYVCVGDCKAVPIHGSGKIGMIATVNGQEVHFTLTDVSFIPDLTTNLPGNIPLGV